MEGGYHYPTIDPSRQFHIDQAKIDEYKERFPTVDVEHELWVASQWCRENPDKRKPSRSMGWFLVSWLQRTHKRISEQPKDTLPYHTPYRNKRGSSFIGLLRVRYGGNLDDRQLLVRDAQHQLDVCRKCHMAYNLKQMRGRLVRYLVAETDMPEGEADVLASESLSEFN